MTQPITKRQLEAAKLYKGALSGDRRDQFKLYEQVAFSDLPAQLTPLIRRTLLDSFTQAPTVWNRFASLQLLETIDKDEELDVFDFRDQSNIAASNLGEPFVPGALPNVGPENQYQKIKMRGSSKYVRTTTLGESFGLEWQAIINTRGVAVNLLDEAIKAFGEHAAGAEDVAATKQLVNGGGISASLGTGTGDGGNHLGTDAPLASILDVQAAVRQAQTFIIDGVQVYFDKFALVVPPNAVSNAKQVLSSKLIASVGATSARAARYEQIIDLGAEIDVVSDRFLTQPTLGGTAAKPAWFLVPVGGPRPVISVNKLRGYENPSYWLKNSNAVTYGSGSDVPILEGDFDTDAIESKVRHVVDGSLLWQQGLVWSAGTGSATAV
jgi:hypothetical protein